MEKRSIILDSKFETSLIEGPYNTVQPLRDHVFVRFIATNFVHADCRRHIRQEYYSFAGGHVRTKPFILTFDFC